MDLVELEVNKKRIEPNDKIPFATVVEVVAGKGVKIKTIEESAPTDTYYNSLAIVNVGDRVLVQKISGTTLITGKLQY